jgi:Holliday junction resolvase-like predicted endonuclease
VTHRLSWLVTALALSALALVVFGGWWKAWRRSRRARRRGARAVAGERAAEALLAAAGYRVLDRQVALDWTIAVGEEDVVIALRADLIVADGDRVLVAEVKTGDAAPMISTPATRRQLLEYLVAFDADGVLLVDVEAGALAEIDFFAADAPSAHAAAR